MKKGRFRITRGVLFSQEEREQMKYLEAIRSKKPIVQCITNIVTANDCANILLAAGASATMAHHPLEMEEIQSGCQALVCNLGATESFDAMLYAGETALKLGHPIVIDPVGCGGSSFRRQFFFELAKHSAISCIRGNYGEILALSQDTQTVTGVDMPETMTGDMAKELTKETVMEAAVALARRFRTKVVASGAIDLITDGNECFELAGGDALMSRITGAGCMSSALLGAYLSVEDSLESVKEACERMKKCGELAAEKTRKVDGGTMTFRMELINAISKDV